MKKYFIPVWWEEYNREYLKGDIPAGFTLGVMLIPQGMAYAMLAGMPAIYGLYTAIFPALVYAWLGSSRRLAVGPAAITCILVNSAILPLADIGTSEYIIYAALLSVVTGFVYIMFMILRLSKMASLLIPPINKGFAASGGIIVFANQLNYLFDVDVDRSQNIVTITKGLIREYHSINWITFSIGIGGILLLYFIPKWKKSFPIALVVIIVSILIVWGMSLDLIGVSVIGLVPEGFPELVNIPLDWNLIFTLLPKAVIIFLVGFTISISVGKILAEKNNVNEINPQRELFALGLSNIASGIVGGVAVNGSLSRTMVNDQAGAKSGVSLIVSAVLIVFTLLFLTPLFYYLPKAILASVILVAISKLINPMDAIGFYKSSKSDFMIYMVTFLSILMISIEWGIVIGIVFSLILKLFKKDK